MSAGTRLLLRIAAAMVFLAGGLYSPALGTHAVRAATPTLIVIPVSAAPHAVVQLSGSGFDPSTSGHQVLVDVSVRTSEGTVSAGTATVDGSGQIGTGGSGQITLPVTLDAPGPNQVIVVEEGNTALTASTNLTGIALQPSLNGGQPDAGQPGATLDVKGGGFAPGDVVSFTLNGQSLSNQGQQTVTADSAGTIDLPFVIPQSASGVQTLVATGSAHGAGQNDQATVQITVGTVTPTNYPVKVSPNPAAVGTAIHISATGFQPGEQVSFALRYFDTSLNIYSSVNSPATADANGAASAALTIPTTADPSKPATVIGRGVTSGLSFSAPLSFAQLATLTINPSGALPGATITIVGTGFVPNEAIYATSRLFKPPIGRLAVSDATGSFTVTEMLLSTLQIGTTLPLAVSGSGGDQASVNYTVGPAGAQATATLLVTPTSVSPGGTVTVSGTGFGAAEGLSFTLAGTSIPVSGMPPLTSSSGAFTATLTLPSSLLPGSYALKAVGLSSQISATVQLTIGGAPGTRWYFAESFTGQGPTVFFHEQLSVLNPGSASVSGTITYFLNDGSTEGIPLSIAPHSLAVEDVNRDIGPGRIFSITIQTDRPVTAERTILRTDKSKHTLDTDYSPGVQAPQQSWYFAEGYSGVSFQPYLVIQNPSAAPVTATVTLNPTQGAAMHIDTVVAANGRATLNLRSVLPNRSFSVQVVATAPVVAERVEYWGPGAGSAKFGAGVKPGAAAPGKVWYFAFNSVIDGDQSFLSLYNPGSKTAHAQVVLFSGAGAGAGSTRITVGPNQRQTVVVNTIAKKRSPITAIVSSDQPLTAEQAQYFQGSPNQGSHAGAAIEGRQGTAHTWSFAAGDTAQYQETEYIFNPSSKRAVTVAGTFYGANHQTLTQRYTVRPLQVITISANSLKALHSGPHGSVWSSADAIVVAQVLRGKTTTVALADQGVPQ